MGYWTRLHLVDIKIRKDRLAQCKKDLPKTENHKKKDSLSFFMDRLMIDSGGFLCFKTKDEDGDPCYVPDKEDGSVPALDSKWDDPEPIAKWVKRYSENGGSIIFHSLEADGGAWGWVFDGRGRMKELELRPVGRWK